MPVVRRIKNRGATITVEAHAEVLLLPGGSVNNWTNRFVGRIRARTIAAAPANKRPRWAHYGKPLKSTIISSRPRFWGNGRDAMRLYAAVGSTAPHAMYVDQGTGIYGGSGPYPAKILPPWTQGGASLYEHTWRPAGPRGRRVAPVMIRGQQAQHFFDKGLSSAFTSMRMRSFQLPGEGTPKISDVMASIPSVIENFVGNTASTPAFIGQLEEWRAWRDAAWKSREGLGRGGGVGSRAHLQATEAGHARRTQGLRDYRSTKAAAEQRKKQQVAALRAEQKRKAEGKRKRDEAEAKSRAKSNLRAGNAQSKREALEAYRLIKMQYKDATFGQTTLSDGVVLYQIKYTMGGGEVVRLRYAHGYNTD